MARWSYWPDSTQENGSQPHKATYLSRADRSGTTGGGRGRGWRDGAAGIGADGGWGGGEDGGFDLTGAGEAEGGGRGGEGAAGGGEVVDEQDPAAGQPPPGPGRRPGRWRAVQPGPAGGVRARVAGAAGEARARVAGAAGVGTAGAAEVAAAGRGEQLGQGEVEGGGDAGGDPLGVVAGWAGDPAGGDVGDQVGPGPGRGQGGAETTAELGQGGRLAVELAGQHGGAERVPVRAERPHRQVRVGGQGPWPDGPGRNRQAAATARPRLRQPTGQAPGRQQPSQGGNKEHARRLAPSPGDRLRPSTAPARGAGSRAGPTGRAIPTAGVSGWRSWGR